MAIRRGAIVESVHRGRFVFCDPSGNVLDAAGDPDAYVYARSSAKPFQALPLLLSGAADTFGLSDAELAVACASHNAEEPHLEAVRSLLQKAGLSEDDLQSGAHPPMYAPEAAKLTRAGDEPRPIHGNCSGKHAGMLAVCAHEGLATGGYRSPDHPLQLRILELVAEVCGLRNDEVLVAGDDCGVPAFALPLKNLATGFARITTGDGLSDEVAAAAARVWRAMRAHPFMVAGTGRLDTELMGSTDLVCKSGAEGVFAAGSSDGWGLAIKISDGGGRAVRPAAVAALGGRGVGVTGDERRATRGLHGEVVGEIGPLF
ncbi:asparaginase [Rubrobacter tropicus]|uniref:asparaginase n=1 Tax=Rubrobacter tropicus TaxID=2653851 RepID=UPI001409AF98|nr:asparaginase [Rubrobacter tropicus]